MQISMAHLRARATTGGDINYVVFAANARNGTDAGRAALLRQLTIAARRQGLRVDQSALAYQQHGRIQFYGDRPLVAHLSRSGVPRWTHTIEV